MDIWRVIYMFIVNIYLQLIDDVGADWLQVARPGNPAGKVSFKTRYRSYEGLTGITEWHLTQNVGDSREHFKL